MQGPGKQAVAAAADPTALVLADRFELDAHFTCFLTHCNLVPVMFRRQCVTLDCTYGEVWEQARDVSVHRQPVEATRMGLLMALGFGFTKRDKVELMNLESADLNGKAATLKVLDAVSGRWGVELEDGTLKSVSAHNLVHTIELAARIGQPLNAKFHGEPASGPGVNREFLEVGLQSALADDSNSGKLFDYSAELRSYWFSETTVTDTDALRPAAFRACGALMGHAILLETFLPPVFPQAMFMLVLKDLGSSHARRWTLNDLACVSPSFASSLESLVEYSGDDVAETFELDWPRATELSKITPEERGGYVSDYVNWYFDERFAAQAQPFCEGFRSVVCHSKLICSQITSVQLEMVICGAEDPMDVAVVKQHAVMNEWTDEHKEYLQAFWEVVEGDAFGLISVHLRRLVGRFQSR